jgi:hypothetical protein
METTLAAVKQQQYGMKSLARKDDFGIKNLFASKRHYAVPADPSLVRILRDLDYKEPVAKQICNRFCLNDHFSLNTRDSAHAVGNALAVSIELKALLTLQLGSSASGQGMKVLLTPNLEKNLANESALVGHK